MAYSQPVHIQQVRDQAALISMTWKEEQAKLAAKSANGTGEPGAEPRRLETLTIEFDNNNLIVRAIQPHLLLVLVGGVPPNRKHEFTVTAEAHGDPRYPSEELPEPDTDANQAEDALLEAGDGNSDARQRPTSITSTISQYEKDLKLGVLHCQRKKTDKMTEFIRKDFDSRGFVMPDESHIS
jgi:hypothetical protein